MMKKGIVGALIGLLGLLLAPTAGRGDHVGLDYPHCSTYDVGCDSCHYMVSENVPEWVTHVATDLDDTPYNNLCWSCHNNIKAPYVKPHSSLTTSDRYHAEEGGWAMECRTCHWVHHQKQVRTYGAASYKYSGQATALGATTLTEAGAGWAADAYKGYVLVPNVSELSYQYQIIGNTAETLTVEGPIDLTKAAGGNTFAIFYGKLIGSKDDNGSESTLHTPYSSRKVVRLFANTGANSFADGDATYDGVCEVCHTETTHYRNDGSAPEQHHENLGGKSGTDCIDCHAHVNGFGHGSGGGGGGDGTGCSNAAGCHQDQDSHPTHVGGMLSGVTCLTCHQENNFPFFADGQNLTNTTVCTNCHSADGAIKAKQYWWTDDLAQSWLAAEGEASFCGSCHDATPGNSKRDGSGDNGFNVLGNQATYGFYLTGHGKPAGSYSRLAWQDTSAAGNPAANQGCAACHDFTSQHFNNPGKRLKAGFENDQANANCNQCHPPGTAATANPQFYTTSAAYENSAHSTKLCTDCHEVHGAPGAYKAMTKGNDESLCNQCHGGVGGHPGVGSATFVHSSKTYTLECTSCHNVHLVSGTYAQADQNKSPVSKFSENTNLWGDVAGEKMSAYGGTYRTPNGEAFSGAELPDYATFCIDCHSQPGGAPFGLSWAGDPHGLNSANQPNGYGTCPNWFACGQAQGWNNDDCTGSEAECWPVIPRGKGDELFSRPTYNHEERIAGVNFALSCTDCHTGHGTGTLGRSNVNGGSFSGNWNSMCNNCHYYYSDWHAGMACGNASCHVSNSIHRADKMTGSGGTRTFNPALVLHYAFESTLKDSGGWEMDGKWYSTAGSFTGGKVGQAGVFGEDIGAQVGTENGYWSTDAGYHGTWVYTEMKYNTTLEAWVYPTDSAKGEYTIFTKHTGYGSGGYRLALKKVGSTLRAAFNCQIDNNSFAQGGAAGVRGAYSAVAIPLNAWTHIAATFDTAGADRNPSDPSAGRIRIYVNGEDVTTSDASGNSMQPAASETSMFAYSENSPWNEAICFNGTWCASEFAIGGFDWEATNYIGRIDEAKVWNTTKNAAYFSAFDAQAGPYISSVEGLIGSSQLTVRFSEGVYASGGAALTAANFTLTDTNNNNPRTITGVSHTAGAAAATLTMSAALTATDVDTDTLAAASSAIFDDHNIGATTATVTIGLSSICPTSPLTISLNEASGSTFVMDTQSILYGAVSGGAATLTGSAYSGDGSSRYIDFEYNTSCLQADRKMTLEARIKPTGLAGSANYLRRLLSREGTGGYQVTVYRNNSVTDQDPPTDVGMIALWSNPVDAHGGDAWKLTLTDFASCPIRSDKWYQVKVVWDADIATSIPAKIYVDDQGTDGSGAGESWAGYIDCTDGDQSQIPAVKELAVGDVINGAAAAFTIGANSTNHANNLFNGLIDWITWKDSVD